MGFSGEKALAGGQSGAARGSAFGPWGAAIGGGIHAVTAGFGAKGYFGAGEDNEPWYDEGWFNQRAADIGSFETQLATARTRYLTSLGQMYDQAYSRFSGNAEAGFATRGLAVNGGAFASALAKKAADYQAELTPLAYKSEREDLGTVQNLRSNLFGQRVAAKTGANSLGYKTNVEDSRALGGYAMNQFRDYLARKNGSNGGEYGSAGFKTNSTGLENPNAYPRNSFRGNPLDLG